MKKLVGIFIVAIVVAALYGQSASAHVLITDTTNTKGAILHITPDDDPIAGDAATLYFDMQGAGEAVSMTITDAAGVVETSTAKVNGSLATSTYTFPAQGVYRLTFTEKVNDKKYTFVHSQRVSRGVTASALDTPLYPWAELLLIASGVAFAVLVIVAFNRRKTIARHSTF